eukprot:TRINITY_DN15210_c0_g1_i4.p1 TRINITY_DN15210_c0_g1~~TRINITY_DN15210_c0_g1_i4.p1  ORF type:complete len:1108 (-),score=123.42 TRINITY_DN15210_c0_g1_i4:91-3192(-)
MASGCSIGAFGSTCPGGDWVDHPPCDGSLGIFEPCNLAASAALARAEFAKAEFALESAAAAVYSVRDAGRGDWKVREPMACNVQFDCDDGSQSDEMCDLKETAESTDHVYSVVSHSPTIREHRVQWQLINETGKDRAAGGVSDGSCQRTARFFLSEGTGSPGSSSVEQQLANEVSYDTKLEIAKALLCVFIVASCPSVVVFILDSNRSAFEEPVCDAGVLKKAPLTCEPCGHGGFLLPVFGEYEQSWPRYARAALYLVGLLWTFLGIGIVCDQFMGAIEEITSCERTVSVEMHKGTMHKFKLKVWNLTVANLTLMALGSSAPEILLNVVEICGRNFFAGEIGPSTIVGSAAFNLLVITAVCVSAIPADETRRVKHVDVYTVTASWSLFAYLWIVLILKVNTEDKVDVWEALLTLFFFPMLTLIAWLADTGKLKCRTCCPKRGSRPSSNPHRRGLSRTSSMVSQEVTSALQARYGQSLSVRTVNVLLKKNRETMRRAAPSRAKVRSEMMAMLFGGSKFGRAEPSNVVIGFSERSMAVFECCGKAELKVIASTCPGVPVSIGYRTVERAAKAGSRFRHSEGALVIGPKQTEAFIEVNIIDNDIFEPDEDFVVQLFELTMLGCVKPSKDIILGLDEMSVIVLNDDVPGTLSFDVTEVFTFEGETVTVDISRGLGSWGSITVDFQTVDGSAVGGRDYKHVAGSFEMVHGESHGTIRIPTFGKHDFDLQDEMSFKLVLKCSTTGVLLDPPTEDENGCPAIFCDIVISKRVELTCFARMMQTNFDRMKAVEFIQGWAGQFANAIFCNGSSEEQSQAGLRDWMFHSLCVSWKLLFAFVPPVSVFGGWLCFVCALVMIGAVTVVVGDLASFLGCCIGIPDDITAITLVALGTSLPDTFASKLAAEQDDTADNSIGNVVGSNSVNVFLGLGLPWAMASIYWEIRGPTPEWHAWTFRGKSYSDLFAARYPQGGFVVPAGPLVASVASYTTCALACIFLLFVRRRKYGGELGGPACAQKRDSILLVLMWVVHVCVSIYCSMSNT